MNIRFITLGAMMLLQLTSAIAQPTNGTQTPPQEERREPKPIVFPKNDVENEALFMGGTDSMYLFLTANTKYPTDAQIKDMTGKVWVDFWVEKDGRITGAKVQRGLLPEFNEEALRVVRSMPKWIPATKKDQAVRAQYTISIYFNPQGGDEVHAMVDEWPQFPGGPAALKQYIKDNLKYPAEALEKRTWGRVFIGIVIERDGSIQKASIKQGIGDGCEDEAKRLVKNCPKWIPGRHNGVPVRTGMVIPIDFELPDAPKAPVSEH